MLGLWCGYVLHLVLDRSGPNSKFDMIIPNSQLCGFRSDGSQTKGSEGPQPNWEFVPRSVEAMYAYLGSIVRMQWNNPQIFENMYQVPRNNGLPPFFLFKTHRGAVPGAVFSESIDGIAYSLLPDTPADQDKSTQVLSLLTDLWALQLSSKSFPSMSTISVVAP